MTRAKCLHITCAPTSTLPAILVRRRMVALASERRAIAAPMVEVAPRHMAQCVTCFAAIPAGWKLSRCEACWEAEGVVADRNRRIARGETP